MATLRTVTGTIKKLDGSAWASWSVIWQLIEEFVSGTETVLPWATPTTLTTDSNGQFSIALAVPSSGTAHYQFTLPDGRIYDAYLATGSAIDISTIIVTTQTAVAANDLQVLLAQAAKAVAYSISSERSMDGSEDLIEFLTGTFAQHLVTATGSKKACGYVNSGAGTITLTAQGGDLINGSSTRTLAAGMAITLMDIAANRWLAY